MDLVEKQMAIVANGAVAAAARNKAKSKNKKPTGINLINGRENGENA